MMSIATEAAGDRPCHQNTSHCQGQRGQGQLSSPPLGDSAGHRALLQLQEDGDEKKRKKEEEKTDFVGLTK